jgi:hypothetical protein
MMARVFGTWCLLLQLASSPAVAQLDLDDEMVC